MAQVVPGIVFLVQDFPDIDGAQIVVVVPHDNATGSYGFHREEGVMFYTVSTVVTVDECCVYLREILRRE